MQKYIFGKVPINSPNFQAMRFKTIAFALIVTSAAFILGCDDEDSSTIGGGGRLSFQVNADASMLSVSSGGALLFVKSGTAPYTTDEISVTKGQNIFVSFNTYDSCANRQVKALLNGSQFDTRTWNMGISSLPCPDLSVQQYNLIIP